MVPEIDTATQPDIEEEKEEIEWGKAFGKALGKAVGVDIEVAIGVIPL